jgi:UDP-N-acetyl-D-mannosaminuronate dehydrogenase
VDSQDFKGLSGGGIAMSERSNVVVVGLGEVGNPLFQLISRHHNTVGVDILPVAEPIKNVDFLHICYPFEIKDFVGETARYIERFQPKVTIINSTVGIGTTRSVAERASAAVVHSPVRGKHVRMLDDLGKYMKFVGGIDSACARQAARHFESVGLKTRILSSPEACEVAKLTETTYFGLMIAWAQEVERYCDRVGADYNEVVSFYEEIKFFPPVKYVPGIIGGHCVIPNIEILSKFDHSAILKAIQSSNKMKIERDARNSAADAGKSLAASANKNGR